MHSTVCINQQRWSVVEALHQTWSSASQITHHTVEKCQLCIWVQVPANASKGCALFFFTLLSTRHVSEVESLTGDLLIPSWYCHTAVAIIIYVTNISKLTPPNFTNTTLLKSAITAVDWQGISILVLIGHHHCWHTTTINMLLLSFTLSVLRSLVSTGAGKIRW